MAYRKKGQLSSAADVLQLLLEKSQLPLSHQFKRWKLWNQWSLVVGESISQFTTPVNYDKGILAIWVNNSAQLQDLHYLEPTIRLKINEYIGKKWVRKIRFTLDRRAVPRPEEMNQDLRDFLSKPPPNVDVEPPPDL